MPFGPTFFNVQGPVCSDTRISKQRTAGNQQDITSSDQGVTASRPIRSPRNERPLAESRDPAQDYVMALGKNSERRARRRPWQGMVESFIEDADSALALLVALVFTVLGPLGIVSQAVINGSILGTLAILAIMMFRYRAGSKSTSRRMEEGQKSVIQALKEDQGTRKDLRGIVDDIATVRVLRGTQVQQEHAEAREKTERWHFKGGTGTYLRAVTLPKCLEDKRRRFEFQIEIIDPRHSEACRRYDNFRLTRPEKPEGTEDSWEPGRARLESYATILAAYWYKQDRDFLTIKIALTSIASTFRYDLSSSRLIITRDDPGFAEVISSDTPLFAAYDRELAISFGQAQPIRLDLEDTKIRLSKNSEPREVRRLLDSICPSPEQRLSDQDAAIIAQKTFHPVDPYPTENAP